MFFASPPMNVSSISVMPDIFWNVPVCMASRMRCSMNHADFCVTPCDRANSCDEMLFLALAISHTAGSHLSHPSGLSSKMVPTLSENCLRQPLHFQIRRVETNDTSPCPQ